MNEFLYINTDDELTVGKSQIGEVWDTNGDIRTVVVKCIRPATYEEYLEFVTSRKLEHLIRRDILDKRFYYVQVLD